MEAAREHINHLAHHLVDFDFLLQGNADNATGVIELLHLRCGVRVVKSVDVEDLVEFGRLHACHASKRSSCFSMSFLNIIKILSCLWMKKC
jgi:hypothetical protein